MWKEDYKITTGGIFGIGATVEAIIYKTNTKLKTKTGRNQLFDLDYKEEIILRNISTNQVIKKIIFDNDDLQNDDKITTSFNGLSI